MTVHVSTGSHPDGRAWATAKILPACEVCDHLEAVHHAMPCDHEYQPAPERAPTTETED